MEFGHGLSFTQFRFAWAAAPPSTVAIASLRDGAAGPDCYDCSRVKFAVNVTNVGAVAGDAVVLGFAASPALQVTSITHAHPLSLPLMWPLP